MNRKTYSQKVSEVNRKWILIDASEAPLGRVSTVVAKYLTGKYKPTYTPHIDAGDNVVIINADKLIVTGNKELAKKYYHHTGYPGGIKEANLGQLREKNSTKVIEAAVKGMLPKNKLQDDRLKRLKIYKDENHTHAPQKPVKVEVK